MLLEMEHVVVRGEAARHVVCEMCRQPFDYVIKRKVALDTLPFPPLVRSAERIVRERLARRLARDVDAHPCPGCGWVQAHMVPALRAGCVRGLRVCGGYIAVVGVTMIVLFVGVGVWMQFQKTYQMDFNWLGATAASGGLFALGWVMMLLQSGIARLCYGTNGHQGKPSAAAGIRCRCGCDLRGTRGRCPQCGAGAMAA